MKLACATCPVRDRAACAVLNESERETLASAGRMRRLSRGQMLFAAGDEDTACATLLSGALKVCLTTPDGSERILALIHPAGFVGELFRPFADYDVVALTESTLCTFARRDMEAALRRYPALGEALLRRSQDDVHAARDLLALTARGDAKGSIAALVLALARAASDSPCHPARNFELPLTRGEMGQMLGLTIETVSRQLTLLEREGSLIRKGTRGIELVDPARLEVLAGKELG